MPRSQYMNPNTVSETTSKNPVERNTDRRSVVALVVAMGAAGGALGVFLASTVN